MPFVRRLQERPSAAPLFVQVQSTLGSWNFELHGSVLRCASWKYWGQMETRRLEGPIAEFVVGWASLVWRSVLNFQDRFRMTVWLVREILCCVI